MNIRNANSTLMASSVCLGADSLLQLLKNYCRTNGVKTSITVGIIGYPNGRPAASTSLGDGFTIARAILYPRDIKIEAYASLFPSDENSSSSSNSEVGA